MSDITNVLLERALHDRRVALEQIAALEAEIRRIRIVIDNLETWHPKKPDGSPDPDGVVWCDYDEVRRILGMESEK